MIEKPVQTRSATGTAIMPTQPPSHEAAGEWQELENSEAGKRVSEETYWAHYYDHGYFSYEWNNGILEEVPVPDYAQVLMYGWFLSLLRAYLEINPIAKMLFLEVAFRLVLPDKTVIRKPDLYIVHNDNPAPVVSSARSYAGIPDLCVESVSDSSPSETERDTVVKKEEYVLGGVREYYLLDAYNRHMRFYQRTPDGDYVQIDPGPDGVIRSGVLPGFQFRIADLFRQPTLLELSDDPLYAAYVLPEYQAEKRRAETEHARAEAERARAEQLAAKLRELGVDVD